MKGRFANMAKRSNGEGSIYKRANGTWIGTITFGRNDDGTLKRKSFSGSTKNELLTKINEFRSTLINNTYLEPSKVTVKKWLSDWLENYKSIKLKPTTYDCYEMFINKTICPVIGDILLQELKPETVQNFYNKIYNKGNSLSSATVKKIHIILKSALNQAVTNGLIIKNPANKPELPVAKKKDIKVFTLDEQKAFEKYAIEYRLYPAFITNLDTGLRMGELLALTWDDIDLEKKQLYVNKNVVMAVDRTQSDTHKSIIPQDSTKTENSNRVIPLTKRVLSMLKELKLKQQTVSNIVFCNQKGGYMLPRNYERTFQKIIKKANIETCNVHTLRHSFATRLFENNVAAKTVSELLGHSSVAVTLNIYTHVLPNKKTEAVEILDSINVL